jgi:hypothetical protein
MAGVPEEAIEAARTADRRYGVRLRGPDSARWRHVPDDQIRRLLEAAAPAIIAAERERLACLLDAEAGRCYDAADSSTDGGLRPPVVGHVAAGDAHEHAARIIREAAS